MTDITERARLFYDGRQAYVFGKDTNGVLPVDRDNLDLQLFLNRYGVVPSDDFFKHVLHAVRLEAQERGKETTVFALAHYDVATNRVYLFDNDRHVYRISKSRIEKVENGTDGVLFVRNPKWEPFAIGTPTGNGKLLTDTLLGSLRLGSNALSREELELLFASWLYAMFFPELFPTRPILAMIGEKGSGKTSVLRRIGQMLFGPKFQVMGMSHEPKDFDAAVTGDAFVGIDNADANVPWLDDKLAVVATGGMLKRRLLYTTNQLVEFPITAFVAITSRTPHFRREDVADRLLLFHVERLETFGAEGELLSELTGAAKCADDGAGRAAAACLGSASREQGQIVSDQFPDCGLRHVRVEGRGCGGPTCRGGGDVRATGAGATGVYRSGRPGDRVAWRLGPRPSGSRGHDRAAVCGAPNAGELVTSRAVI